MRYVISAEVDTTVTRNDYGTWRSDIEIPQFTVSAPGEDTALNLARTIIDPLHMTDVRIRAEEIPRAPWRRELEQHLTAVIRLAESVPGPLSGLLAPLTALAGTIAGYISHGQDDLTRENGKNQEESTS